jgi:hypothetical protein
VGSTGLGHMSSRVGWSCTSDRAKFGVLIPCVGYPGFKPPIVAPEPQIELESRLEVVLMVTSCFLKKRKDH